MAHGHHYYVPHASKYTALLAVGIFLLALGFILKLNAAGVGAFIMVGGAAVIVFVLFRWFGAVIRENVTGKYTQWEDRSYRWGMGWFIFSEVMFFAAFFGTLYYLRIISVPELASFDPAFTPYPEFTSAWPSSGPLGDTFTPMGAWGIPALNTLILLTSGATITWAHWGLLKDNRKQLISGLALTILLGVLFMGFQAYEYIHAYTELDLTMEKGAYGGTFFMLTGFHGLHVTLGATMLTVILLRSMAGHFSSKDHFGFEAVAWYWHFVDVVWLGLFVFVYWL
ncbi:MAG: cytochrome c oxidase subunit 3 [Ectothiorhodospiraceae bacterium]|nr:cytochrome c oxidase subunit 3 [Ectothiorhodospiraceae bacterium]